MLRIRWVDGKVTVGESRAIAVGTLIGDRYAIESELGRGGLATVYRARDTSLGRTVALKIIAVQGADSTTLERSRSEIELLASLSHHALVTLFDAGDLDGNTVLVMELVDGPDLGARLARGPISPADVARMTIDLAEALHTVHERGIVHRDIKPGNVLLAPSSLPSVEFVAKLADFGIAYLIDSTRITATGTLIGTAAYLSPEQARGAAPGPASDIYSLGLVLLESLTGTREFTGSLVETVAARLSRDPSIPDGVDDEWRTLLSAMTAQAPADRPNALEVALAARSIEAGQHIATAPTVPFASVAEAPTEQLADVLSEQLTEGPAPTKKLERTTAPVRTSLFEPVPEATLPEATLPKSTLPKTELLAPAATESASSPTANDETTPRKRWPWILAVAAAVIVVGAVASIIGNNSTSESSPTPAPTLPALDEPLGTHLNELLEAVNP